MSLSRLDLASLRVAFLYRHREISICRHLHDVTSPSAMADDQSVKMRYIDGKEELEEIW